MERAALIAWHKELAPAGETSVVFRDSAFADDVAKTKSDRYSPAARSQQCEELVNMAPKKPEKVQQPRPLEGGLIRVG
jgi:hypothetical protein